MVRVLWAEPDVSKDARRLAHAEVFMGRALTDAEEQVALDPGQILIRTAPRSSMERLVEEIRWIVRGRRDG